jgi:hypothetical protein
MIRQAIKQLTIGSLMGAAISAALFIPVIF